MSGKKIDERVVEMRFDNQNFEKNVQTSMSTLEKLKQSLKFKNSTKELENVGATAKKIDFAEMSKGIETVNARFSNLQVIGMTALSNITTAAMNAGSTLARSLTLDPIIKGFQEYETQINAVQTILANTQSKGSTLQDVNRALDELNKYADQTIYNFTEMTKNIGTFTAAGVDLEKSVTSIKGIANLAAVSGSTSLQASTAMYQLSQALAAGRVSLMDWNSVVNAGMGGEVFQTALKRTAENMGTDVDALIEKYGSFRESLTRGEWLTADVLTETLTQLSGAYTEADLLAKGYTKSQAQEILQLAETAVNAATKVKTFTQLFDTLGEALQSGWTQSWEIIIGDFDEAQAMLTKISETLGNVINESAESRNNLLMGGLASGWKQLLDEGINDEEGFVASVKAVAKEHGTAVDEMMKDGTTFEQTLKSGWLTTDVLTESMDKYVEQLSGMSDEQLRSAGYTKEQVAELKKFSEELKTNSSLAEEFVNKMKSASGRENIIAGLWNVFEGLGSALMKVKEAFRDIFPPMTGDQLYDLTVKFEDFTEKLKPSVDTLDRIKRIASGVFSAFDLVRKGISALLSPIGQLVGSGGLGSITDMLLEFVASIGDFFTILNKSAGTGNFFSGLQTGVGTVLSTVMDLFDSATQGIRTFGDVISWVGGVLSGALGFIGESLGNIFGWIGDNVGFGDIFAGLTAGGTIAMAKKAIDMFNQLKDTFSGGLLGIIFGNSDEDGEGVKDKITGILDGVHDSLDSFTSGINAASLLTIAGAIGILSASINTLSKIEAADIGKSLGAIAAMMVMLNTSFTGIIRALDKFSAKGIVKAGASMILMATALNIFANAIKKMSSIPFDDVVKGLIGLGVGLAELTVAMKAMSKVKVSLKNVAAMVVLAKACDILAEALGEFAGMSMDDIGAGLTAMGGALAELTAVIAIMNKVGGGKSLAGSVSLLIAVQSLADIAEGLKAVGSLSWETIERGLKGIGGALGELTVALAILSKAGGGGAVLGAVSILIAVQSLADISQALSTIGNLSWETIERGLKGMGGALAEIGIVTGALGKLAGVSGLLGAGSILIAAQSLEPIAETLSKLGKMSWDEIGRGLAAMGGALAELGLASALTGLSGIAGLVGAGTILLAVQGLDQLANGLQKFGDMSWDEIGRGLTAMGGALGETGLAAALTGLSGIAGLVGAGTINLTVQSLDELATSLQKFGDMSWDEIERGLAAMGAALGETALGGLLNTLSGFGAGAIATIAEPLGTLADSVQKWSTVTVPEGLGDQLGQLAGGVASFWNSGWGADAISTVAEPLGTMADSIKNWTGVSVPEGLGDQIGSLADGISAFWASGWGADAISTVAGPLGTLADSVSKWTTITVPENLQANLQSLATGVKAFDWSWGNSLGSFVEPLSNMADSVNKWAGITMPPSIETDLTALANGVKAFDWSWGYSLGSFVQPLTDLAGAMSKWNGVSIPANIGDTLTNLAEGCKAFNWSWGSSLESFIEPLDSLSTVLPKYSGLAIATDIGDSIASLGDGVKSLSGKSPGEITGVIDAISNLADAVTNISGIDFAGAASKLTSFATAIDSVNISGDAFSKLGTDMVANFVNSLNAGVGSVQAAASSLGTAAVTAFTIAVAGASAMSASAGIAMVTGIASGISSGSGVVMASVTSVVSMALMSVVAQGGAFSASGLVLMTMMSTGLAAGSALVVASIGIALAGASSTIRGYYSSFYSAGTYIASGLAAGINSGRSVVTTAARNIARAAVTAARAAAGINSPSKEFYAIGDFMNQGLTKALGDGESSVYKAGYEVGHAATDGLTAAANTLSSILDSDLDSNPTITPVVDLTNVRSSAAAIGGMLGGMVPVGVVDDANRLSYNMNRPNQNGSLNDVVSSINKLRGDLAEFDRTQYNINGITYDDGSNIATAVGDLTRAIRIERRI